ncbi:hypothetical protein [Streptomyces sp. NPDC001250]|uniref:hypothetical protein n=1 Tax=unclassified Streptomyces TaxID=2593676 RepID=UPI00332E353C
MIDDLLDPDPDQHDLLGGLQLGRPLALLLRRPLTTIDLVLVWFTQVRSASGLPPGSRATSLTVRPEVIQGGVGRGPRPAGSVCR